MAAVHPPATKPTSIGRTVRANLSVAELYEDAVRAGEGMIAAEGPLVVRTGQHTGRSPQDKFIVREPSSRREDLVGRGQPAHPRGRYDRLRGAPRGSPDEPHDLRPGLLRRRPPRPSAARCASTPRRPGPASSPTTCSAGRRPPSCAASSPNFTIINAPSFKADPARDGTRSETAILVT